MSPRRALGAFGATSLAQTAAAQTRQWKHGLSLFGEPKYPADFKHFDYVNPAAPQGGTVRQIAFGTFDNFNHGGLRREGQPRATAPNCSPKR